MKNLGIKVKVEKRTLVLYGSNTHIRVGRQGVPVEIGAFLGKLSKGEARRIRKALRTVSLSHAAGVVRYPTQFHRGSLRVLQSS